MKIFAITSGNVKSMNFRAGKTKLYTDFDGTFFPSNQFLVKFKLPDEILKLQKMYCGFSKFFEAAKGQFSTIITTGRDISDMEKAITVLKNSDIKFPPVQGYVFEDGLAQTNESPVFDFNNSTILFYDDDFPNKLTQTKNEVRKIVETESNDLVIVAGNEWNDADMLNPLNYIDIFDVEYNRCIDIEQLLSRDDVLNAIRKLPLVSIVSSKSKNLKMILKIKKILDKKGIYKIFYAKNPESELLEKIKQGMFLYGLENNEYKKNLSPKLKQMLMIS